jgi:hypothetical protein
MRADNRLNNIQIHFNAIIDNAADLLEDYITACSARVRDRLCSPLFQYIIFNFINLWLCYLMISAMMTRPQVRQQYISETILVVDDPWFSEIISARKRHIFVNDYVKCKEYESFIGKSVTLHNVSNNYITSVPGVIKGIKYVDPLRNLTSFVKNCILCGGGIYDVTCSANLYYCMFDRENAIYNMLSIAKSSEILPQLVKNRRGSPDKCPKPNIQDSHAFPIYVCNDSNDSLRLNVCLIEIDII